MSANQNEGGGLFAGVTEDDLEIIIKACTEQTFLASDIIFAEGDAGDSLWIIESGRVEIFKTIRGDVDRVLGTFGPGEIFGEMSFVDGSRRSAGARTVEASHVFCLQRSQFDGLSKTHPAIAMNTFAALAAIMAERLRHINDAYKESVSTYLETAGLAPLHLHRMVENLRSVTLHLIDKSQVSGRLLDLENQPCGWALFIKDSAGKVSLVPYNSIVRIEVA